ncbi:hypothetical protein Btru_036709 [Bulinus truncatus]|nr:hypothetical protein Btru_036709 [Bulinus truncatus]
MSSETVYVAIGIACVVAVLLFIVFIIYCVKRHNDKMYSRQARQRRLREERHRRHLMMGHLVRPPPYDPDTPTLVLPYNRDIPFSPPPAYKEVATPMPRNGGVVGIGDLPYGPPVYDYLSNDDVIPTVSSRVAPPNSTHYMNPRGDIYNNSNNNRTANLNSINSLRARPLTSPSSPVIILPPDGSSDNPYYRENPYGRQQVDRIHNTRREMAGGNNRGDARRSGDDVINLQNQQRLDGAQRSFSPTAVLAHSYNSVGPPSSRNPRDSNNNERAARSIYNSAAPAQNNISGSTTTRS